MLKSIRTWTIEPPLWLALAVAASFSVALLWIWGGLYPHRVVPVGWTVVLLCGLWFNRRWLLWTLAGVYAALIALKLLWLMDHPGETIPSLLHLTNILVTAVLVHFALVYRDSLRSRLRDLAKANADLEAGNAELLAREEEIGRQNEELQLQAEELEQQSEELRAQSQQLEEANLQLVELNKHLERRVAERTAIIEQRAEQLRDLALQLVQTEHRERRQLARILHDHLQQLLVAAKLKLGITRNHPNDGQWLRALSEVDGLLSESIEASRSLTVELSPPILYDSGLPAALAWLSERKAQKYGLNITLDVDPSADPDSDEIAAMLFSATRELLFNVMKHAGVEQAHIKLGLHGPPGNQQIALMVEDHGRGFDVSILDHPQARDRFGLFSIRERLLALGGDVQIETRPGHGTRVTLCAPCNPLPAATPVKPAVVAASVSADVSPSHARPWRTSKPQERQSDYGHIRVLLADDHKILREGLAGLLRDQPDIVVVGEASDGQMAVNLARKLRPHVIIMDVSMPKINGIEATRLIHGEMPDVRIIGLSMHGGDHIAQCLREAGAEAYLTKGGPSDALVSAIRGRDSTSSIH